MKTWILTAVLLVGFNVFAQHGGRGDRQRLTAEQRTELQVKKLTLELDLNDSQKANVQKLFLDKNKKVETAMAERKQNREAGQKLTNDQKFEIKSKMLDEQITTKAEMKKILTKDQYEKWGKMRAKKKGKFEKRSKKYQKGNKR